MKIKKKVILGLTACCALLCSVAAFAACDTDAAPPAAACEHSWNEGEVTTEPTCTEEGVKTFTCSKCEDHKTEPVSALDHSWGGWKVTKIPEGDVLGEVSADCTRANCTEKHTAPLPLADSIVYARTADDATCTKPGKQHFTATIENKTVEFDVPTLPKGHVWSNWKVTNPTDGEEGLAVRTCGIADCDGKESHNLPVLTSKDYVKQSFPATCEDDGQDVYTITFGDDEVIFYNTLKATGHNLKKAEITAETQSGDILYDVCQNEGCDYKENQTTYLVINNSNISGDNRITYTEGLYHLKTSFTTSKANIYFWVDIPSSAVYEINFEFITAPKGGQLTGVKFTPKGSSEEEEVVKSSAVAEKYKGVATLDTDSSKLPEKFIFDATDYSGTKLHLTFAVMGNTEYKMNIKAIKNLKYGSNTVTVTDDGVLLSDPDSFTDTYTFVSDVDKTYSMTVPENVTVWLNGEDFIVDDTWANFEAKAGEPIKFAFSGNTGNKTVLIGDEIIVETELKVNGHPVSATLNGPGSTCVLPVNSDVPEGEYYLALDDLPKAFIKGGAITVFVNDSATGYQLQGGKLQSYEDNGTTPPDYLIEDYVLKLTLKGGDTVKLRMDGLAGFTFSVRLMTADEYNNPAEPDTEPEA